MKSKKTALYDEHVKAGAKIVEYHGWELPIQYSGLIPEHLAVRNNAGMFDVSHMGILELSGKDRETFLQNVTVNDISRIKLNCTQYNMVCNEKGFILDDIMVSRDIDKFIIVVNASNIDKILKWFEKNQNKADIKVIHRQDLNILAVQGPNAVKLISAACDYEISINRFSFIKTKLLGKEVSISATGYTGEEGVELFIKDEDIPFIWKYLLKASVTPCGLGARDTLRIEAGLPLYGQELSEEINPLMTNYGWVVKFDKGNFIGKESILAYKNSSTNKKYTYGVLLDTKIARHGYEVVGGGEVTSGTYSAYLKKPIAMILTSQKLNIGDQVKIKVRSAEEHGEIVSLPFFKK